MLAGHSKVAPPHVRGAARAQLCTQASHQGCPRDRSRRRAAPADNVTHDLSVQGCAPRCSYWACMRRFPPSWRRTRSRRQRSPTSTASAASASTRQSLATRISRRPASSAGIPPKCPKSRDPRPKLARRDQPTRSDHDRAGGTRRAGTGHGLGRTRSQVLHARRNCEQAPLRRRHARRSARRRARRSRRMAQRPLPAQVLNNNVLVELPRSRPGPSVSMLRCGDWLAMRAIARVREAGPSPRRPSCSPARQHVREPGEGLSTDSTSAACASFRRGRRSSVLAARADGAAAAGSAPVAHRRLGPGLMPGPERR